MLIMVGCQNTRRIRRMSTGFDEGGTDRLVCGIPTGGAATEAATEAARGGADAGAAEEVVATRPFSAFKPNMFLGNVVPLGAGRDDLAYSVGIPIGAADFSVEFWYRAYWGSAAPNADIQTGIWLTRPVLNAGIYQDYGARIFSTSGQLLNGHYRDVAFGGAINENIWMSNAATIYPVGWNHYCMNLDRNTTNTMTAYQNALTGWADSAETPISNVNMGTLNLTIGTSPLLGTVASYASATPDDWTSYSQVYGSFGPFAIHNRILTVAEMRESAANRTVQNLGAAVTLVNYDWRSPLFVDGWDFESDNILEGVGYLPETRDIQLAAIHGTVSEELDRSGNGRNYPLNVSATYDTPVANQAVLAYGVDKFFYSGGYPI